MTETRSFKPKISAKEIASYSEEDNPPLSIKPKISAREIASFPEEDTEEDNPPLSIKPKINTREIASYSEEDSEFSPVRTRDNSSFEESEVPPMRVKLPRKDSLLEEGKFFLEREFELTGDELGEKFAQVVREEIEMTEFKEFYNRKIADYERRFIRKCKINKDKICTKEWRHFAKMQLYSLLLSMNTVEEWTDWLRRYMAMSPNPVTMPTEDLTRPILFKINSGRTFTEGDQKPMWILAVLAASGSIAPVYVHGNRIGNPPREIANLATWLIGINWQQKLRIVDTVEIRNTLIEGDNYIEFNAPGVLDLTNQNTTVEVDFGDNSEGKNRFVTCLMLKYRPKSNYFGSLYLPIEFDWSNPLLLDSVRSFRSRHSKIACFAGSQRPPAPIKDILEWLDQSEDWGAILIGSQRWKLDEDFPRVARYDQIMVIDRIAYEDIAKYVDFFVTNCGAGSVAVAFAAGCPQQCSATGSGVVGYDKIANRDSLLIHEVGPVWKVSEMSFIERMRRVDVKLDFYKANAQKAKEQMERERLQLWTNMPKFFKRLSQDPEFQSEVLRSGIPNEFGLGLCTGQELY